MIGGGGIKKARLESRALSVGLMHWILLEPSQIGRVELLPELFGFRVRNLVETSFVTSTFKFSFEPDGDQLLNTAFAK